MKSSFVLRLHVRPLVLLSILLVGGWGVPPALCAGFDLDALMALLAGHPPGRASFVETRDLGLLDRPIESRGELVYVPPDRLERHAESPRKESAILDGDTLTLIRGGRRRELSIQEVPDVAVLIGSLRAVLAGDRAGLERDFELNQAGTPDDWILDLIPKDPALAETLRRIHLAGHGGEVRRLEMIETDGDRSVIQIGDPAP